MDVKSFYLAIQLAISNSRKKNVGSENLLTILDDIIASNITEENLKITQATILFEGFCKSLLDFPELKNLLLKVKINRWKNHYGTPTIEFLLTFNEHITKTSIAFETKCFSDYPWLISKDLNLTYDNKNNVLFDPEIMKQVKMPAQSEKTGQFIKTHNPSGGFTTTPCDPYSQQFIESAKKIGEIGGNVLEIGAAFGAASLQALKYGATVFCNDIEPQNLAVIYNRYTQEFSNDKLILVPGSFPEELLGLPKNYFDAILICRVLHFFPGKQIEQSLQHIASLLKQNGKVYIICETPYLKNWQKFIPEHEKRMSSGIEWPGEIFNPAEFESSGRAASLPQFVHWITKEVLDRTLNRANLKIDQSSYINRAGQFPDDLILNGQESVGAIAIKQ